VPDPEDLVSRIELLDERDSISDRMQNTAITDLTKDLAKVFTLIDNVRTDLTGALGDIQTLKTRPVVTKPVPWWRAYLSRKLFVTVLSFTLMVIQGLTGILPPEWANGLAVAAAVVYMLSNVVQKFTIPGVDKL
jgi:hypothetical protein